MSIYECSLFRGGLIISGFFCPSHGCVHFMASSAYVKFYFYETKHYFEIFFTIYKIAKTSNLICLQKCNLICIFCDHYYKSYLFNLKLSWNRKKISKWNQKISFETFQSKDSSFKDTFIIISGYRKAPDSLVSERS